MERVITIADMDNVLSIMKILFSEQDFNIGGTGYNKFELLFNILIKEECTEEELKGTMLKFIKVHRQFDWMPADIYSLFCKLYKPQFAS